MIERTNRNGFLHMGTQWEARLVVASTVLLSGLAVADRLVAWLIGEFPTSAMLWALRFELLRPIAVFYDIAAMKLGVISPASFSVCVVIAAALIVAGAMSQVRLARALALHGLLGGAVALTVYSIGVEASVGSPSPSYALLGAALALPILVLCLKIHGEYLNLSLADTSAFRRLRLAARRSRRNLQERAADYLGGMPMPTKLDRLVPVALRADARRKRTQLQVS